LRFVSKLHNKHKDVPVWIAGSDPTLANYPDGFFADKIGITLHMAHVKFPDASYRYANEYDRVEYLSKTYDKYILKENIFALPFYGKSKRETRDLASRGNHYFLRLNPYPPRGIRGDIDWAFTRRKVIQARKGGTVTFGGHGTCLHGCLYVAILMGANPINIIACGHGSIGGNEHFAGINEIDKEMRPEMPSFSDPANNLPMIEQTLAIKSACEKEGIKVNWYRDYGDDGQIAFDPEEIKEKNRQNLRFLKKETSGFGFYNFLKKNWNTARNHF
jgi:hypothetical protein